LPDGSPSLIFFGGVGGEVGGNQILLADPETKTKLFLDFGCNLARRGLLYPFPMAPRDKEEMVNVGLAPRPEELFSRPFQGPVSSAFISHPHADHYLCLCLLPEGTPVLASPGCLTMMDVRRATRRRGPEDEVGHLVFRSLEAARPFEVGPDTRLTPYYVDHSAFGSMAALVEAGGRLLAYTGDIRFHGPLKDQSLDFERILEKKGPDVLVVEATNAVGARMVGEEEVKDDMANIFGEARGLVVVDAHLGDIWRISSIISAAKEARRDVLIPLKLTAILEALKEKACRMEPDLLRMPVPDIREPNILIYVRPKRRLEKWERELLARCSGEVEEDKLIGPDGVRERAGELVLVSEYPILDVREVGPPDKTILVHARSEPFNETGLVEYEALKAWLRTLGIPMLQAHSSGHASLVRIAEMVERAQPERVVVVHTPEPALAKRYLEAFCPDVVAPGPGEELTF